MRTAGILFVGALLGAAVTTAGFLLLSPRPSALPAGDPDLAAGEVGAKRGTGSPAGDAPAANADPGSSGLRASTAPPTPAERDFLAAALREERRRREAAVITDADRGIDVLRKVFDERADPAVLLQGFERIDRHVTRSESPVAKIVSTKDVTPVRAADLAKSVVVELGPGTFEFDGAWPRWGAPAKGEDVEALEIRGAGSGRTTVRGPSGSLVVVGTRLKSLRLRGFTWESRNGGNRVAQIDGDCALVVEDCRFVGELERSVIHFYFSGRSLVAFRDCVFDGRAMSAGPPMSMNGDTVALFERCRFLEHWPAIGLVAGAARDGAVRFVDCSFEGTPVLAWAKYRGRTAVSVTISGGRVVFGSPAASEEERRRLWGGEFAVALEDVTFTPDPSWPTVGTALAALERLPVPEGQKPLGVHLVYPEREGRPAAWNVDLWTPHRLGTVGFRAYGKDGAFTLGEAWNGNPINSPLPEDQRGSIEWGTLLRTAGVPMDADARGLVLAGWSTPPPDVRWAPVIQVEAMQWPPWRVEIPSGRVLSKPAP